MSGMKKGFGAVEAAVKKAATSSGDGKFLSYVVWKDDNKDKKKIVRFIGEPITADFYEYVRCADGRPREFVVPASLGESHDDYLAKHGVKTTVYGSQELVPAEPREMTVGLVALREEYRDAETGKMKVRDVTETIEVTEGEGDDKVTREIERVAYRVVKQGYKNFWSQMIGIYNRFGTLSDRDYEITRNGNSTDTTYTIIPLDPIDGLRTDEEVVEHYDPPLSLEQWTLNLASYDRAKALFEGKKKETSEGKESAPRTGPVETNPVTPSETKETSFADLREELLNNKG